MVSHPDFLNRKTVNNLTFFEAVVPNRRFSYNEIIQVQPKEMFDQRTITDIVDRSDKDMLSILC